MSLALTYVINKYVEVLNFRSYFARARLERARSIVGGSAAVSWDARFVFVFQEFY